MLCLCVYVVHVFVLWQVVFEPAAPVGNTEALAAKEQQLFPHLVSFRGCCYTLKLR